MKKFYSFILLSTIFVSLAAQDINISFQPAVSGTNIDSIWVTNQRTNEKIKLLGNESLTLTKVTSVEDLLLSSTEGCLFPNPCNGRAEVSFATSLSQEVKVSVYNISGQLLSTKSQFLMPDQHRFTLSFPGIGMYNVSVLKNEGSISYKIVCLKPEGSKCIIKYTGTEHRNQTKSAVVGKALNYVQGDILNCSAYSGKNNTIIADSPTASKSYSVEFYECIDPDKQSYPIVKIGNQWWMAKNLAYIPYVNPPTSCYSPIYYVNGYMGWDLNTAKNTVNYKTYGVLYDWHAAMNSLKDSLSSNKNPSGVCGICPKNWHLPSNAEWEQLADFISDSKGPYIKSNNSWQYVAKHLKAINGWSFNGTDDYGFSALPGGYALDTFGGVPYYGYWWTSTQESGQYSWCRSILGGESLKIEYLYKNMGMSVRCIKD